MIRKSRLESRNSLLASIALLVASIGVARADTRWFEGVYRNPALGFSVKVPHGLKGMTGDQAGPERGVQILLPSGGKIFVFGEPNSLEWKSPEEGVRAELTYYNCASGPQEVKQARIGSLGGAQGSLVCGDRVTKVFLAFRTGGEPIYFLRLETIHAHEVEDEAILENVAASFKLIRRE